MREALCDTGLLKQRQEEMRREVEARRLVEAARRRSRAQRVEGGVRRWVSAFLGELKIDALRLLHAARLSKGTHGRKGAA